MERQPRQTARTPTTKKPVPVMARRGLALAATIPLLVATCVWLPASASGASPEAHSSSSGGLQVTVLPSVSTCTEWSALNDSNQLAGARCANNIYSAAQWRNGIVTTDPFGGGPKYGAEAFAIDDAGEIFGGVYDGVTYETFPAIWSPTGALTKLTSAGTLAQESTSGSIKAVSNNGNVVGASNKLMQSGPVNSYYALAPGYNVKFLPSDVTGVAAINNSGEIAVSSTTAPYLWVNGAKRPLKVDPVFAHGLNNNGDVAGYLVPTPASGIPQAAIELANGSVEDLPSLQSGDQVIVTGINDHDEVVGEEENHAGDTTPVAWIDEKVVPITSLVAANSPSKFTITPGLGNYALDVNNNGSILAESNSTYYLLSGGLTLGGTVEFGCSLSACGSMSGPLYNATVDVEGPTKVSTTTDTEGKWSVPVVPGEYSVTPSAPGVTFNPKSIDLKVTESRDDSNFSGCTSGSSSSENAEAPKFRAAISSRSWKLVGDYCASVYSVDYSPSSNTATVGWNSLAFICNPNGQVFFNLGLNRSIFSGTVVSPSSANGTISTASNGVIDIKVNDNGILVLQFTIDPGGASGTVTTYSDVYTQSFNAGTTHVSCRPTQATRAKLPFKTRKKLTSLPTR